MFLKHTVCLMSVIAVLLAVPAVGYAAEGASYAESEALVQFKNTATAGHIAALNTQVGAEIVSEITQISLYHIRATGNKTAEQLLAEYRASSIVTYAELNYQRSKCADPIAPNDPELATQWHHTIIDSAGAWGNVDTAASLVKIGVIDDGVHVNHPDLAANIWTNPGETAGDGIDNDANGLVDDVNGWDLADGDEDPSPDDPSDTHGTHVAGIIAAVGNNGEGVTGVMQNAQLVCYKTDLWDDEIILGIVIAAAVHEVKVINCSFGGQWPSRPLQDAVTYAHSKGVLIVAAAGNDDISIPFYPAACDHVLSVAATEQADELTDFSSRGFRPADLQWVDVAAPGKDIYSTVVGEDINMNGIMDGGEDADVSGTFDIYDTMDGTSMASPVVSGVAGLIFSKNPAAGPTEVYQLIVRNADALSNDEARAALAGAGRVNAANVVDPAVAAATPDIVPRPLRYNIASSYRYPWQYTVMIDDTSGDADEIPDPGETVTFSLLVSNLGTAATNVTCTAACASADVTITNAAGTFGDVPAGEARPQDDTFALTVAADAEEGGIAEITLAFAADGGYTSQSSVWIPIGRPRILLVDDDWGMVTEPFFIDPLRTLGYGLAMWHIDLDGLPTEDDLSPYDLVIYNTAWTGSGALDTLKDSVLPDYLDGRGNLLLVSQDLMFLVNADGPVTDDFLNDYLNVSGGYLPDPQVGGITGTLVGPDDMEITLEGNDGSMFWDYAAELLPGTQAKSLFFNEHGHVIGTMYPKDESIWAGFRTMFLSFMFERVPPDNGNNTGANGVALLEKAIELLLAPEPPVPQVEAFYVEAGDGVVDLSWNYPGAGEVYDGVIVVYDTAGNPALNVTDDREIEIASGTELYRGDTDTEASVDLENGTAGYFAIWTYRGYRLSDPIYVTATPAVPALPSVSQFQIGAGSGYMDVEWVYPEPMDDYDGVIVAYGTTVFPTLQAGDDKPVIIGGVEVYDGNEDSEAQVILGNGTTAYFVIWTYRGTQYSNPNYAVGTPAVGGDGINEYETFDTGGHGGGSHECFITTARRSCDLSGAIRAAGEPPGDEIRQKNFKKLQDARVKFLELFRKAKKPKEGPGRIVGYVVAEKDGSAVEGAALKATLVKKKAEPEKGKRPKLRADIGAPEEKKGEDRKTEDKPEKKEEKVVEAKSGRDGVYELEGLPPGRYKIEVTADGYQDFERKSVFVNSGIGPGLGAWVVVKLKDVAERKGSIVGRVTSVEATHKHIEVKVKETGKDWENLKGRKILLLSGTDARVLTIVKTLEPGKTEVECRFVERGGQYHLLSIEVEEED